MEVNNLIEYGINNNASDILLSTSNAPYYRIYSELSILKVPQLTKEEINNFLKTLFSEKEYDLYINKKEFNFNIRYKNYILRIRVFENINGTVIIIRLINQTLKTLEEIEAPAIINNLCKINQGLILVTGGYTSGKTTTLHNMINHINHNYKKHIVTIENNTEYQHLSSLSLINQKQVEFNSNAYCQTIQRVMREDPDIILIDELYDYNIIKLALMAAERGHLVLSTFPTRSAVQTIQRFIDLTPLEERDLIRSLLSNSLEGIISQTIIKKIDGSGVKVAFEVMFATSAIKALINEGKIQDINLYIEQNKDLGMITMKDSISELIQKGIISSDNAVEIFSQEKSKKLDEDSSLLNKESF